MQKTGDSKDDSHDLEDLLDAEMGVHEPPGALIQPPVPPPMEEGRVSEPNKKPEVSTDGSCETPTTKTLEPETLSTQASEAEVPPKESDCRTPVPTSPAHPLPMPKVSAEVPAQKVATPCRGAPKQHDPPSSVGSGTPSDQNSPSQESEVPSLDDTGAVKPIAGQIRLSENAINLRMHRLMKVDSKGNSKISAEIRKQYHTKKGKLRLQQIFQSCGYEPDWLFGNFSMGIVDFFGPHTL